MTGSPKAQPADSAPSRPWAVPAAVFGAALTVRLAVAREAWERVPFLRTPVIDGAEYANRAAQVAAGEFWSSRLEIHPPLYGWLLGGIYAIFGAGGFAPFAFQALLGACTAVLLWRFTALLAGPRPAAVAGTLAAFAWPAVFQEAHLSAAAPSLFLGALALNLAEWASRGRAVRALAPGLAVGLAGLSHGLMLAFGLVLLLPLLERTRRGALAAAAGVAAALIPVLAVCAHNASLDDGAYALQANVGLNTWIGNREDASGYPDLPPGPKYDRAVDEAARAGAVTAPEQDRWFRARVVRRIAASPGSWLVLLGRKALGTWGEAEIDSTMDAGFFRERLWTDALACVRWGWLVGLAVPGAVLLRRAPPPMRALWLAAAVAAGVPLVLLVTSNRYRVPLLLSLIPAAAVAAEAAWRERRRLAEPRALALAGAAVAGAALSYANFAAIPEAQVFRREILLGNAFAAQKDYPAAERSLRAARAADPADPVPPRDLARVFLLAGHREASAAALREALALHPAWPDALSLATIVFPEEEWQAAFVRAEGLDPGNGPVWFEHGKALLLAGRPAVEPLRKAVELQPRRRSWRARLGDAFLAAGRVEEGEREFRTVLEADPGHAEALYGLATGALMREDRKAAQEYGTRALEAGHPAAAELLEKAGFRTTDPR